MSSFQVPAREKGILPQERAQKEGSLAGTCPPSARSAAFDNKGSRFTVQRPRRRVWIEKRRAKDGRPRYVLRWFDESDRVGSRAVGSNRRQAEQDRAEMEYALNRGFAETDAAEVKSLTEQLRELVGTATDLVKELSKIRDGEPGARPGRTAGRMPDRDSRDVSAA